MQRLAVILGLAVAVAGVPAAAAKPAPPAFETIRFPSEDGLLIEADLYMGNGRSAPMIVLFHQAGWSRGEYREIALELLELGFNAMAVDARSGGRVNGVINQTHRRAAAAKKPTSYLAAMADLRAALRRARRYTTGPVIAWGSSYSAGLVLRLAGTEPQLADATLAFSPGEYFRKLGKPGTWVRDAAKRIEKPVFITSARGEKKSWRAIYAAIPAEGKAMFLPEGRGQHGSRALWSRYADSSAYWKAVRAFLSRVKP